MAPHKKMESKAKVGLKGITKTHAEKFILRARARRINQKTRTENNLFLPVYMVQKKHKSGDYVRRIGIKPLIYLKAVLECIVAKILDGGVLFIIDRMDRSSTLPHENSHKNE